jgi:hypothetical protein
MREYNMEYYQDNNMLTKLPAKHMKEFLAAQAASAIPIPEKHTVEDKLLEGWR